MEFEILDKKISAIESKLESVYQATEKTRKYFLWSLILQLAFVFIPLVILMFVLPFFLSSYLGGLGELL